MPSPNDTFYNLKRLHLVFALSSLALLAVTVWMVAADHGREWKVYQRTFRDQVEPWTTQAAIRQQQSEEPASGRGEMSGAPARQSPSFAKRLLRLPRADAFGRPLAIDQVWLPELGINYNFCQVARFDRCTTCHQGIDKAAGGSAAEPAYRPREVIALQLATPAAPPESGGESPAEAVMAAYGLALAPHGVLDPGEVTVGLVLARTAAARAGLLPGDVLLAVDGRPVAENADALRRLLEDVAWGKPVEVEVRRGLPHPYRSHPRLELFVGSHSPHPLAEFGCTICHDGQGSATEFRFASHTPNDLDERARWRKEHGWFWNPDWDFPMRPARFAQSNCLKCHHEVVDLEPTRRFPDPPAAKLLAGFHLVRENGCFGCHEIKGFTASGERVGPDMRLEPSYGETAPSLPADPGLAAEEGRPAADTPAPGTMRKVGPSLRGLAGKLDAGFASAFVARPAGFRPETRMPQFFGMHEHLEGKGLDEARRFEPVEIRATIAYLLAASRPVPPLDAPPGVTAPPSAERGRALFETQGCLACHKHADFPAGQATRGPDLSRIGAKLGTPAGRTWLASWIRNPARHSPRTRMPNPLLETAKPQAAGAAKPQAAGAADPAADIAAYLLGSGGWQPEPLAPLVEADLDALALGHLGKTFPRKLAEKYLREGIPPAMAGQVQADALELLGETTLEKKLRYVGRRTIRKRGCFGCHDIPGFEDAQPIGPPLSDWGRKQTSQLAFEQVHRFVLKSQDVDRGYYLEALLSRRREGFLWQKLRAPRSFDYQKTANQGYHEQLLMGRFTLSDSQREAIITLVLGLVAEPPKEPYVYRPDRRGRAIVEGRKVLDRHGCAQCHVLEMERWTIEVDPQQFPKPPAVADYPLVKPRVSPERAAASLAADRRGLVRAELVGMPRLSAEGKIEESEDEEGNPLYPFILWEPAAIAGGTWPVGGGGVLAGPRQIVAKRPAVGGDFARLLYPAAIREAKKAGSGAAVLEAWGWVPPPLAYEGRRVRPAWLYNYLLEPTAIRPAAVLRMPKFNLSPTEAARLVDYFAAQSGVEFPYSAADRQVAAAGLPSGRAPDPQRAEDALRLLTDRTTYCAKCHAIGDYSPGGETRTTLAPNLERVGSRIRPDYLRRWLANPRSLVPYTAMPVNFPPDQAMGQDVFKGSSLEQLDAVTGLLLHYDEVIKHRVSIRELVEAGGKAGGGGGGAKP